MGFGTFMTGIAVVWRMLGGETGKIFVSIFAVIYEEVLKVLTQPTQQWRFEYSKTSNIEIPKPAHWTSNLLS